MSVTFGSLFAGIGGFDLGFERAGMVCKWQVEIDDHATKVLEKHWPTVHRERDIRECGKHNLEPVDVICGGFPCQDISYAGLGAGLDGARSGLFFEAIRLVLELRPRIVVLENVAALLTRGLDRVLGTLAEIGFDAEWHCIPAAAVGAPHIRDRVFVVAYAKHDGLIASTGQYPGNQQQQGRAKKSRSPEQSPGSGSRFVLSEDVADTTKHRRRQGNANSRGSGEGTAEGQERRFGSVCEDVANANESFTSEERLQRGRQFMRSGCDQTTDSRRGLNSNWLTEPNVGRVAHGVPKRVDRLRGLGNAVVPQVAEWIGRQIVAASV
jgi:DNA (cytosine-5)-methyltransferase 1